MSIDDRITALEAEVFCVVSTNEYGYVMLTGCDHDVGHKDWSDKVRCPYCGRKLKGHQDVREIT